MTKEPRTWITTLLPGPVAPYAFSATRDILTVRLQLDKYPERRVELLADAEARKKLAEALRFAAEHYPGPEWDYLSPDCEPEAG